MSQYGGQQSYGQPQADDSSYGGQLGQDQDPSMQGQDGQQDPSQYAGQEPSMQQPDDGQGQQYGQQGDDAMGGPEGDNQDPSMYNGMPTQQPIPNGVSAPDMSGPPKHPQKGLSKQQHPSKPLGPQAHQHPMSSGSTRHYHPTHHNAVYHMSQAASNGFTRDHMDSFLHLGTYALGALANQHGLAPSEPYPGSL